MSGCNSGERTIVIFIHHIVVAATQQKSNKKKKQKRCSKHNEQTAAVTALHKIPLHITNDTAVPS